MLCHCIENEDLTRSENSVQKGVKVPPFVKRFGWLAFAATEQAEQTSCIQSHVR